MRTWPASISSCLDSKQSNRISIGGSLEWRISRFTHLHVAWPNENIQSGFDSSSFRGGQMIWMKSAGWRISLPSWETSNEWTCYRSIKWAASNGKNSEWITKCATHSRPRKRKSIRSWPDFARRDCKQSKTFEEGEFKAFTCGDRRVATRSSLLLLPICVALGPE